MRIGIIGAGQVGTGLAKLLQPRGHDLMLSYSRDPLKLAVTANRFGVRHGSVAEAVEFAEVVVVATPWSSTSAALHEAGSSFAPKVVWDCTNALKSDLSGLQIGTTTSAGEEIRRLIPWGRVVKAIPPFAELMHTGSVRLGEQTATVFVASDDPAAKETVTGLVREIGAEAVDAGPLANARYIEPAGYLLVQLAYMLGRGPKIGLSLVSQP